MRDLRERIARRFCDRHARDICTIGYDAADAALSVLAELTVDEAIVLLDAARERERVTVDA
jgi:hypothetical protein